MRAGRASWRTRPPPRPAPPRSAARPTAPGRPAPPAPDPAPPAPRSAAPTAPRPSRPPPCRAARPPAAATRHAARGRAGPAGGAGRRRCLVAGNAAARASPCRAPVPAGLRVRVPRLQNPRRYLAALAPQPRSVPPPRRLSPSQPAVPAEVRDAEERRRAPRPTRTSPGSGALGRRLYLKIETTRRYRTMEKRSRGLVPVPAADRVLLPPRARPSYKTKRRSSESAASRPRVAPRHSGPCWTQPAGLR